jgi:hypothetical protein
MPMPDLPNGKSAAESSSPPSAANVLHVSAPDGAKLLNMFDRSLSEKLKLIV